jgi:hypothetical protein
MAAASGPWRHNISTLLLEGRFNGTITRRDGREHVGINLSGVAAKGRLEKLGSFNTMVSHRVRLSDAREVDTDLVDWLRQAYEQA